MNCWRVLVSKLLTVVECLQLNHIRAGTFTTWRPRSQSQVIDSGRREIRQQVAGVRRGDRHTDVLSEVRVVVIQLVALYPVTPWLAQWFSPRQLDRVGRAHLTFEVSRRTNICHWHAQTHSEFFVFFLLPRDVCGSYDHLIDVWCVAAVHAGTRFV